MRKVLKIRFGLLLLVAWLATTSAFGIKIEEAQRAVQERYKVATGTTVSWPNNSAGTPAPQYPPDSFYEQDLANASSAASLVQDLAAKLNNDGLLNRFVSMSPEGQTEVQTYSTAPGSMPPVTGINASNYVEKFAILTGYICKLKDIHVPGSQVGIGGPGTSIEFRGSYIGFGVGFDCTGVRNNVDAQWENNPWLTTGTKIGVSETYAPIYLIPGSGYVRYLKLSTTRGKVYADLRNYSGSARIYLLVTPNVTESDHPPVAADSRYHSFSAASAGSEWTSQELANRKPDYSSDCPGESTSYTYYGWFIDKVAAIVSPAYQHNISDCSPEECVPCATPSCPAGSGQAVQVSNSSIDVVIGLGQTDFGKSAGRIAIQEETPSTTLATPMALQAQVDGSVQLVHSTNGIRQAKSATALADIIPIDPFKYEVRFFTAANAGNTNTSGLYQPTGSPYSVIAIENPDGTNSVNRLRITQTFDGSSKVSDFQYDPNNQQWDLVTGNGLRKESRSKVWDTNHVIRTETFIVKNPDDTVVHKRIEKFRIYPWGEEKIEETIDPDAAALTTTWTFYDDQANDGSNYSHLKQLVRPTGYWERYEYDAFGRNIKTLAQFLDAPPGAAENLCRVTTTAYSDTVPPVTVVETLLGQEVSRRYTVHFPDETREIEAHSPGAAWDDPDNLVTVTKTYLGSSFEGETRSVKNADGSMSLYEYSSNGSQKTTTVSTGQPNNDETAIVAGKKTITVVDIAGNVLSESTYDIASGLLLTSATTTQVDDFGRPTEIQYNDGTKITRVYGCCGLESETDREGITTTFMHDDLGRLILQSRAGISTLYTYDAEGRVLKTIRKGSDDSEITTEQAVYDLAGRQLSSKNALNFETFFAETTDGNGHTVKTTTFPGGSTRIETFAKDGSLLGIRGTAIHPLEFEYGVEATGPFTKEIRLGQGGSTSEWAKTLTDFLGRNFKTVLPDGASSQSFFNNKGQLIKQVDPDGVTTLFEYNGQGEQETVAVDVNRNGVVDFAGTDRITKTVRDVASAHGTTVERATTSIWATDGADAPSALSVQETSADGLQSWNTALGLTTHSQTVLDGSGGRTVTVTEPDGSTTVSEFQNGRLTSAVRRDASNNQVAGTTYGYDPHGRQTSIVDARNGPTALTYDDLDQVKTITTAGQTTSYDYDAFGRRTQTTLPDSAVVVSEYFDTGELKKVSGARTYTAEYTYDAQGRLKTLLAGTGTTTWNYTVNRGLLSSKVYADGKGPSYTYTPAGRLKTRNWARGVTTSYTYNNAGDLGVIDYSDATPDVAQNYDRLGRLATVDDAAGTRTLSHNLLGRPLQEAYAGGPLDGVQVSRTYALNRLSTLSASHPTAGTLTAGSYGYDGASRLASASDGTHTATYAYHPNSSLVASVTFKKGASPVLTTTKSFDNLNRLTSIVNTPANDGPRSFTYTYNDANQRTRVDLADGSYWIYTYDSLGQVTSGKKFFSDNTPVPGQQFDYAFDGIGNRTGTTTNGRAAGYSANNLNQYLQRDVPGAFDVFGTAKADATVTVNNQPTTRHDEYFYKELTLNNASSPVFEPVTVVGVKNNVGPNNEDAVTETIGNVYLPKTPEVFAYDDDGNLLSDGRWNYTWDGENRLVKMETILGVPEAAKKKLEFSYDQQSRRVVKKVYGWSSGAWVLEKDLRFVYDDWNLVAELDGMNGSALLRSYVWGTDLSGTFQGAGGVGGLLFMAASAGPETHAYGFDGNGNVTTLVNAADGKLSAEYEYSPFGETLRASGSASSVSSLVFSTKYSDLESTLLYYGNRYLDPVEGRWLSRDPLEEKAAYNIYGFVVNDSVDHIDPLGRQKFTIWASAFIPDDVVRVPIPSLFGIPITLVVDGDNRGYGVVGGSSRAWHAVIIDTDPSAKKFVFFNQSDVGTTTGVILPFNIEVSAKGAPVPPVARVDRGKCSTTVTIKAAVRTRFIPSIVAPIIRYDYKLIFDVAKGELRWFGTWNRWILPNNELFVRGLDKPQLVASDRTFNPINTPLNPWGEYIVQDSGTEPIQKY